MSHRFRRAPLGQLLDGLVGCHCALVIHLDLPGHEPLGLIAWEGGDWLFF